MLLKIPNTNSQKDHGIPEEFSIIKIKNFKNEKLLPLASLAGEIVGTVVPAIVVVEALVVVADSLVVVVVVVVALVVVVGSLVVVVVVALVVVVAAVVVVVLHRISSFFNRISFSFAFIKD